MTKKVEVQVNWSGEVHSFNNESKNKDVIILLHGFGEDGSQLYENIKNYLPNNILIWAPDGPLPYVSKRSGHWELFKAWYFFDQEKGRYITPMSFAVEYVLALLKSDLKEVESITLIGYSQGGYVAPFIAKANEKIKKVVTLNSRWRDEELDPSGMTSQNFSLNALEDDKVEFLKAKESFVNLKNKGLSGEFIETLGDHSINEHMGRELQRVLSL